MSAVTLFVVITSIYAIVGNKLFAPGVPDMAESSEESASIPGDDGTVPSHATIYFGTFSSAFITVLGVATGFENWTWHIRMLSGETPRYPTDDIYPLIRYPTDDLNDTPIARDRYR